MKIEIVRQAHNDNQKIKILIFLKIEIPRQARDDGAC